jgi:outer membrane protein assembly factor BamD (BamD/ComL family)
LQKLTFFTSASFGQGMATTVEQSSMIDQSPAALPAAPATEASWIQNPMNRALVAAGVVALLGVGSWVAISSGKRKEEFAAQQLSTARAAYETGNLPLASTELQKVITTFKGTAAASEATITLNQVRLANNQAPIAAENLKAFIATSPEAAVKAQAYGLLGVALENSNKPLDAAEAYRSASSNATAEFLKAEYLLGAGRAYRTAGKPVDAERTYRELLDKFPKAPSATEAEVRLGELTKGKI